MAILTINIADRGTSLQSGGASATGHMWFTLDKGDGSMPESFGFAPDGQHEGCSSSAKIQPTVSEMGMIDLSIRPTMVVGMAAIGFSLMTCLQAYLLWDDQPQGVMRPVTGKVAIGEPKRSPRLVVVGRGVLVSCITPGCAYPNWQLDKGRDADGLVDERLRLYELHVDGSRRFSVEEVAAARRSKVYAYASLTAVLWCIFSIGNLRKEK